MASPTTANGFDRFNEALRNLDDQLQDFRERFEDGRKRIEGEIRKRRTQLEGQLRKNPVYRRVEQARKDVGERVDRTRSQLYDIFGIASKSELDKINRKLNTISKKISELAKDQVDL